MRKILILLSSLFVFSCGSSGGGGDGFVFYGGVYEGVAVRVHNDCPVNAPLNLPFLWNVNQDDRRIVLTASSGHTWVGAPTPENPDIDFLVAKEEISGGCLERSGIAFSNVTRSSSDVFLLIQVECPRASCQMWYSGNASRKM